MALTKDKRAMLKNYLKVTLRTLYKNKGYAFINTIGLAFGMASIILIFQFVQHETSYDRFYTNVDQIYRVNLYQPGNAYLGTDRYAVTPPPLSGVLRNHYPDIDHATSLRNRSALLSVGDQHYWEEGLWADKHFFDVFSIPLLQGNVHSALASPDAIVLTKTVANKLFNGEDALNQVLQVGDEGLFTVTGIAPDAPVNASIKYGFITSHYAHASFARSITNNIWGSSNVHTFFSLKEGVDIEDFEAKLPGLVFDFRYRGDTDIPAASRDQYFTQALSDIHMAPFINFDIGFHGETRNGVKGDKRLIYLFIALGCVIILLACINYMNLAIARSIRRSNEVGLRKAIGARRIQIAGQFLSESILIAGLALVLALLAVELLTPFFASMVDRPLTSNQVYDFRLLAAGALLIVIVGFVSGSYPAFFMSGLKPIDVLKGKLNTRHSRFSLQRLLIVGQYTASMVLIACGFAIYQQLHFIKNKDLGYDLEQVVTIRIQQENHQLRNGLDRVREAWLENPNVSAVTASSTLPVYVDWQSEISGWEGSNPEEVLPIYMNAVDHNYLQLYGIELTTGRDFSVDVSTDEVAAAIINQSAARTLGWTPEEAIGKQFKMGRVASTRTIIGVAEDFHAHSMRSEIRPYVFYLASEKTDLAASVNYLSAKIHPDDLQGTLASMRASLRDISPYPVEFRFLDDRFAQLYHADESLGKTIGFFTFLALIIASMGLFGLAAYAVERRTKEIGLRKVLGAPVATLTHMLLKDFVWLVLIAALVATPIAYLTMQYWLEGFAYRIEIGPGIFLTTIALTFTVALFTVGHQTLKAAFANPVQSLRHD
ncbi:MAG: ABC transporter permease [Bacteroidota bacterium]